MSLDIERANQTAVERMTSARPKLKTVARAGDVIPGLREGLLLLHAGPPIEWPRMSGPLRGAVIGGSLARGVGGGRIRGGGHGGERGYRF